MKGLVGGGLAGASGWGEGVDVLDAYSAGDEDGALDRLDVNAGWWPDEAAAHAHFDLLPLYVLYRLP